MLFNCGVGEDSWESLGLQRDPSSPSQRKSVLNIHWRTDAEAETPILWPPDAKSQFIVKDPDAGKNWRQEEKGMTDGEMVGWHHWLEFEQALGDGEGQGNLACCSPWGHKEWDTMTEHQQFETFHYHSLVLMTDHPPCSSSPPLKTPHFFPEGNLFPQSGPGSHFSWS